MLPLAQLNTLNTLLPLNVLRVLTQAGAMSVAEIAEALDEEEFDIEEVLEDWFEFLVATEVDGAVRYRFYHSHFSSWLAMQL